MGNVCFREDIDFDDEMDLRHFHLFKVIGRGAFSKVRIVEHRPNSTMYALKYISKKQCSQMKIAHSVISERCLLERIHHPLIVNLRYAFQDDEHIFMVLDLMLGGNLRYHMGKQSNFPEERVRFYVADIALALNYLHQKGIAHRDIKPDNILLDSLGHAHLSDFNIGVRFSSDRPYRTSKAGSTAYMAPEVLNGSEYSTSVDWWSLGVTAYEILFGKRPFHGSTADSTVKSILEDALVFPHFSSVVSKECLEVISGLLTKDPCHRLGCGTDSFLKVQQHAWFAGMDWHALESKQATAPFVPSCTESNFDPAHALEEFLLEEAPLRPHKFTRKAISKQTDSETPLTVEESEYSLIENRFLCFDYRKNPHSLYTCTQPPCAS
ncbi:kinase-like protein [Spinellus fusiger]|nr:kinase-like protein [Spinellus fusiger]